MGICGTPRLLSKPPSMEDTRAQVILRTVPVLIFLELLTAGWDRVSSPAGVPRTRTDGYPVFKQKLFKMFNTFNKLPFRLESF